MKPTLCKLPALVFMTLLACASADQSLDHKNEAELVSHITQILTAPPATTDQAPCPSTSLQKK